MEQLNDSNTYLLKPQDYEIKLDRYEESDQNEPLLMRLPFSKRRPDFISQNSIEEHASRITGELEPHILEGIKRFIVRDGRSQESDISNEDLTAWYLATKTSKYNAVYGISRREAADYLDFARRNADRIDTIGEYIDTHEGVAPIVNYAFHEYVQEFAQQPNKTVITATKSIPRHAVQGYDKNTLVVKKGYILDTDPTQSFETSDELYDWHDLAHMLAAASSNGAFGVKYHDGLDRLDRYYRALTEGEGMKDASGPLFSDGMLFTQLSKPLFEQLEAQSVRDDIPDYTDPDIHYGIVKELFAYLTGNHALLHPGIGKKIHAEREIDPFELAVCLQNKRFERRAAEVEREVFVRGTPEGSRGNPDKDPLHNMNRSERLEFIAHLNDEMLHFEARNLIRHRAHEDALGQFAGHLLQKRVEIAHTPVNDEVHFHDELNLLELMVDFYQMNDLKRGEEINLYQHVGDIIQARREKLPPDEKSV